MEYITDTEIKNLFTRSKGSITCVCGVRHTKQYRMHHEKTKHHKEYVDNLPLIPTINAQCQYVQ